VIVVLYVAAIAVANVLTAQIAPLLLHIDGHVAALPIGTFAIGATFFLRDLVQHRHGLRVAWAAIAAALLVNFALSLHYGDLLAITLASAGAFVVSESADTAIYTLTPGRLGRRVLVSGLVSVPLDSTIFVVCGLSPLTTGIIQWNAVVLTITAQIAVKLTMQAVAAVPLWHVTVQRAARVTT
jgi:uncharacterized PurR-regulated membrane protein YhhQ (DUF165 family)